MLPFALLFVVSPARAWEPVAHKAAAIIARHRLNPAARAAVHELLGENESGRALELEDVAGCADGFAHDAGFRCAGAFKLEGEPAASVPWHFVNIPLAVKDPHITDYCPSKSGCISSQIDAEIATLRNRSASRQARQTALTLLVHLFADAHQPLHCADDGDFGGNKKSVDVELKGQKLNLHKIWDEAMMRPSEVDWRLPPAALAEKAQSFAADLESDLRRLDKDTIAQWLRGDLTSGSVLESWRIAREQIYPQYARDHGAIANAGRDDIGEAYRKKMQPIARRRIQMAGVRLAEILNQALSKS